MRLLFVNFWLNLLKNGKNYLQEISFFRNSLRLKWVFTLQILRVSATNFRIRFGNIKTPFTYTIYLSVVVRKPSSLMWTWQTWIFGSFSNFFLSLVILQQLRICVEGTLGLRLYLVLQTSIPLNLFLNCFFFFVNLGTHTPLLHFEFFEWLFSSL